MPEPLAEAAHLREEIPRLIPCQLAVACAGSEDAFRPNDGDASRRSESPGVALVEHGNGIETLGRNHGRRLSPVTLRSRVGAAERPPQSLDLGQIAGVGQPDRLTEPFRADHIVQVRVSSDASADLVLNLQGPSGGIAKASFEDVQAADSRERRQRAGVEDGEGHSGTSDVGGVLDPVLRCDADGLEFSSQPFCVIPTQQVGEWLDTHEAVAVGVESAAH